MQVPDLRWEMLEPLVVYRSSEKCEVMGGPRFWIQELSTATGDMGIEVMQQMYNPDADVYIEAYYPYGRLILLHYVRVDALGCCYGTPGWPDDGDRNLDECLNESWYLQSRDVRSIVVELMYKYVSDPLV
jgi:hypothetical protein